MNGDQNCIVMESAFSYNYSDVDCTFQYAYLCETPVLTLADICVSPNSYDSVLDICWRLEETNRLPWNDARNVCIADGGDLMILDSTAVHAYIKGVLSLSK